MVSNSQEETTQDVDQQVKPSTSKDLEENNDGEGRNPKRSRRGRKKQTKKKSTKKKDPKNVERGKALAEKLKEMKQRGFVPKPKRSKSEKSGVLLSVNHILKDMKKMFPHRRVSEGAAVYLAGVLEYLTAEVLDLAGDSVVQNKRKIIKPRDILLAIKADTELSKLLSDVIVSRGGVTPFVHQALLKKPAAPKKKKKATKVVPDEIEEEEQVAEETEEEESGEEEKEPNEEVPPAEQEIIQAPQPPAEVEVVAAETQVHVPRISAKRKLVEVEMDKAVNLNPKILTQFSQDEQRAINKYFELKRNSLTKSNEVVEANKGGPDETMTTMTPSNDVTLSGEEPNKEGGEGVEKEIQPSSMPREELTPESGEKVGQEDISSYQTNESVDIPEIDLETPSLSPILTNIVNYEAYYTIETQTKKKRTSLDGKENVSESSSKQRY